MVSSFEKKVKMLKDKRDEVLLDVDAAEKNGKNIYPKVNSWLAKADKMIYSELKEVKGLEDEANNKCFFGFCPNFKARYQLSKKAEEDINVVDELLQQDGFEKAVKDPNVNIIGVHEMLGVGKNTLVIEVDQIVDMLRLKFKEQSVTRRASQLCQRLKKEKNILVVLDDIWEKLDLMEDMDAKKSFPIGVLEHEEAWHYFNMIIEDGVESSDLLLIATKVAKKCGGLPIAIRTLASSLRNEPPCVWEDALRQLNDETMKECNKIVCASMSELPDKLKCPKLTFLSMGQPNQGTGFWRNGIGTLETVEGQKGEGGRSKSTVVEGGIEVIQMWKEKAKTGDEVLDSCSPSGKRTNKAMKENLGRLRNKRKKNKGENGEGLYESPIRIVRRKLLEGTSPFKARLEISLVQSYENLLSELLWVREPCNSSANEFENIHMQCKMDRCFIVDLDCWKGGLALLWMDGASSDRDSILLDTLGRKPREDIRDPRLLFSIVAYKTVCVVWWIGLTKLWMAQFWIPTSKCSFLG
ncbi:hypothetical protein GOBAR_AA06712 [Gossypium barbadense]|uniref:Uncharacterized protein n=1 Tax=Gossypium barbadense TaxID=3634 RepID=A0A2P5YE30_GOSBA|nr:hypothetical protein GOBAR_AA06712 [Gossypium barbadense]